LASSDKVTEVEDDGEDASAPAEAGLAFDAALPAP
jgi:hypothetical protein